MKINDIEKFTKELTTMFAYKWQSLNTTISELIIEDLIKFIKRYNNGEKDGNSKDQE